ncbi:H3-like centromeric protein A [Seminavis robusta]|uniref:H3-like centromeric protein A n=1 Tax=Seminavis robusta TaxID=568900 RepID=A0A9N8HXH5_9STRA|nr:H3-like centromeric protein A [Seminavis robusta]CAB9530903.1 H3-like centromeric protein A [Seminavis robusta]|eukprot:Sro2918_g340220.1 H3-like centromeric protein A (170) ;mRNA; f:5834-6343
MARTKQTAKKTPKKKRGDTHIGSRGGSPTGSQGSTNGSGGGRRKAKMILEIQKYQKGVGKLVPKAPMYRVIRDITNDLDMKDPKTGAKQSFRWTKTAIETLHEVAEDHLVEYFGKAVHCMHHRKKVTLKVEDLRLALFLTDKYDLGGNANLKEKNMSNLMNKHNMKESK